MPAWKKAKQPLYSVSKSLKQNIETETPVVLIDIREAEQAQAGHIKGAVSVPGDQLASWKEKFPAIKSAPVILYGDDTGSAEKYFATVRDWGYKNATVLKGGFKGWQKAGLPVTTGATAQEIVYVPKPKAGSVPVELFAKAIDTKADNVVILDVRTDEEVEEGMIANAVAIPAEEVADRVGELPKGKKVYIHCSTGIRAEMAFVALKDKGLDAAFLDANIKVSPDGTYEITAKE